MRTVVALLIVSMLTMPAWGQPVGPVKKPTTRPTTPAEIRLAKPMPKDPWDYAVQMTAQVQKSPPQIKLVWVADTNATEYMVYRKQGELPDFGKPLATLPGTATEWLDKNVRVGEAYEYHVDKKFKQMWNEQMTEFLGHGDIFAGIEIPLADLPGKVILIVDKTQGEALAMEITRLQDDLTGDGWQVLRHDVDPNQSVPSVKDLIVKDYQADAKKVQAVFLLGHIPVPYAGDMTWHHKGMFDGAWPADVYYGSIAGKWTDTEVNDIKGGEKSHRNIPGDGKFDQGQLTAPAELMVGRVDAWGLTQGEKAKMHLFNLSETELLRRYLDKDHRWRQGQIKAQDRALYFCHEPATVAFMGEPYRNFAATVGAQNITNAMWLPTLTAAQQKEPYLFAWGVGGAGDIHVNFSNADIAAVFTEVGGSGILDWVLYPHLRSPIFSKSYTLSCDWINGDKYYMALGEPIGFCMRHSQNKTWPADAREGEKTWVFKALMGDPTLRLHPVPPVSDLAAGAAGQLTWKARTGAEGLVGYHVYRAAEKAGPYTRLTEQPATGASFADPKPAARSWYMVRAVKLQASPSGSYFTAGQGAFVEGR
jgi:hypothetical protein